MLEVLEKGKIIVEVIKHNISQKSVTAGMFSGWFQQVITAATSFLAIPVVFHSLGQESAGVWFTFQSLLLLIGLIDFGSGTFFSRQVAFSLGVDAASDEKVGFVTLNKGVEGFYQIDRMNIITYRLLTLIGVAVVFAVYELLARFGDFVKHDPHGFRFVWYLLGMGSVVVLSVNGRVSILNGLGYLYKTRSIAIGYFLVVSLLSSVIAVVTRNMIAMAAVYFCCALVYSLLVRLQYRREFGQSVNGSRCAISAPIWKRFLRITFPLGVVTLFGSIANSVQPAIIGVNLGAEKVAGFYLAQRIGQFLITGVLHVVVPRMPQFTRSIGAWDLIGAADQMISSMRRVVLVMLLSSGLFTLVYLAASTVFLSGGKTLDFSTTVLMGVDIFCLGVSASMMQFIFASGRNPFLLTAVFSGIFSVALSYLLSMWLGVSGVVLGGLVSGCVFYYRVSLFQGIRLVRELRSSEKS